MRKLNLPEPQKRIDECQDHGPFESVNYFGRSWTRCPECIEEANRREDEAEAERKRQMQIAAWERKLGQAGIPERFHDRSLDSYRASTPGQQKALAFARQYADDFDQVMATGRSAIFIGKPGTGKTHLAIGIGLHVMRHQRAVLFCTVMRAIRRVKDTWSRDSQESESAAIASLVFPDLLVLDEVGVQFGSEAEKIVLFDVLNERYEKRKPTLLLSNLSIDDVKKFLGERIYDRLREDGGQCIIFDWESHRGKA
jgi:DNA replication protein DnaC